jgi:hypothetical protein
LVGHRRFLLGGVRHFQENLDGPPLQLGPPVRARPRLATLDSDGHAPAIYRRDVTRTSAAVQSVTDGLRGDEELQVPSAGDTL